VNGYKDFKDQVNQSLHPDQQKQREQQDKEIGGFTLVGRGGWITAAKILVGCLLGYWNVKLFTDAIPGPSGWVTALVALSLEATALYCVHNYTRSLNLHKFMLGLFGVLLFLFSLAHATMSVIHANGYEWGQEFIDFYSHVIAFPLLLILLTVAVVALSLTHWSGEVMSKLAETRLASMLNRAQVLMQQARMLDDQELVYLRAQQLEQDTQIRSDLIPVVRHRAEIGEQRARLLESIDDPDLRVQLESDWQNLFADEQLTATESQQLQSTRPQASSHMPSVMQQPFTTSSRGHNGRP
jgi:hypothetical protein